MRRFISASMTLGVLIAPAAAADMPVYDKVPAPPFGWSGFYIGGNIAVASTTNNALWSPLSTTGVPFGIQQIGGGTGGASFAGGGFAGYNWQLGNAWVTGVEADWSGMQSSGSVTGTWLANAGGVVPTGFTTLSSELDWTASVRARIGYLVVPSLLVYGTGGVAWGGFQFRGSATNSAGGYATSVALSSTEIGWVAGVGAEWAPFRGIGLLLRAEYLNFRFRGTQTQSAANGFPTFPSAYMWSAPDVNIARVGASYKFE